MQNIGFIGLGKMGGGICGNLIKNGYNVAVYDQNSAAMAGFKGKAELCDNPYDLFTHSECTFLSLPSSEQVEKLSAGFFEKGVKGKIVIDLSTSYPLSTRKLYGEFKERGGELLDAPVLGNPGEAAEGTLTAVIGGDEKVYKKCGELFKCFCVQYSYVGVSGSGHLFKLAMNFVGLMYTMIYAQMFPLMEKLDIDINKLYETIMGSSLDCGVLRFYGPKVVKRDYHLDFRLELGLKDLGYIKRLYEDLGVPAFIIDGALNLLRTGVKDGRGKNDFSECAATMRDYLGL